MTGYYQKRFRDQWEAMVAEVYADELGTADITPRTSLGELGAGTDAAARIAKRIRHSTQMSLTTAAVLQNDSVQSLSAYLRAHGPTNTCLQVPVGMRPDHPPLFYFHSATGNAFAIRTLRKYLPAPLIGVRAAGLYREQEIPQTIGQFAAIYVDEILRILPIGPFLLCGFSGGGTIAFEVACRLRSRGLDVPLLAMFDSQPPAPCVPSDLPSEEELMEDRLRELLRRVEGTVRERARHDDDEVVATLRRGHALSQDMDSIALGRQLLVFARVLRATRSFVPRHFPGVVHYFAAETASDVFMRWTEHVAYLRTYNIDAEHYEYSIFANAAFRESLSGLILEALRRRPIR